MLKLRLNFSIRSVLLLTAVVAGCVWWFALPTSTANRFVGLVNNGRYDEAASLFHIDGEDAMLTDWTPIVEGHAVLTAWSTADMLRGRRAIHLSVTYHQKYTGDTKAGFFPLEADRQGIYLLKNLKSSDKERFDFK